jgi:hypothetical protein
LTFAGLIEKDVVENIKYQTALRQGLADALNIGLYKVQLSAVGDTGLMRRLENGLVVKFNIKLANAKAGTATKMTQLLLSKQSELVTRVQNAADDLGVSMPGLEIVSISAEQSRKIPALVDDDEALSVMTRSPTPSPTISPTTNPTPVPTTAPTKAPLKAPPVRHQAPTPKPVASLAVSTRPRI